MSVVDNKDDYEAEPQITSSDPEERKSARALRINRRIEAIKKYLQLYNAYSATSYIYSTFF